MNDFDSNEGAFPSTKEYNVGLTKREYFASEALSGIIKNDPNITPIIAVNLAIKYIIKEEG